MSLENFDKQNFELVLFHMGQVYEPPYDKHDTGGYASVLKHKLFADAKEATSWLERNPHEQYRLYALKRVHVHKVTEFKYD